MVYLSAAVVFVGTLCVLDLLLSLGIIRRLRQQNATLAQLVSTSSPTMTMVPVGAAVGDFVATTTTGVTVRREDSQREASQREGGGQWHEKRLVAFLSPGCRPCSEQLPELIDHAVNHDGAVLAVISVDAGAEPGSAEVYVGKLAPVADVVVESPRGSMNEAFQVSAYPVWYIIDSAGLVLARGSAISHIPIAARA